MEMAGFEPALHTRVSRVVSATYLRIPPLKTVTRLSLARLSRCVKGSGLSSHRWSCSSVYRSVIEARELRRPRSTDWRRLLRLGDMQ